MQKLVAYPFTVIYYVVFGLCLLLFHALQVIAFTLMGSKGQKSIADIFTLSILGCHFLLGTRFKINHFPQLPTNRPIILVSNHQSTYDIPPLNWYFRKNRPRYISKKELGRGIPSVSYNLRKGGSALIDRKDSTQALNAIAAFAKTVAADNACAIIFPEGTRSRDGLPKRFQRKGLRLLIEGIPKALILPVSINHSWKLSKYDYFPIPLGVGVIVKVHKPIEPSNFAMEPLIDQIENCIHQGIMSTA